MRADMRASGRSTGFGDIKDRAKELIMTKQHLLDEIKNTVGAGANAVPDKRAQQNTEEISINNTVADGINQTELIYRQENVEAINKLFQLNISVKLRKGVDSDDTTEDETGNSDSSNTGA
jgi:hypothetical protein